MLFGNIRDAITNRELAEMSKATLASNVEAMQECIKQEKMDGVYLHCLEIVYTLYRLETARRDERQWGESQNGIAKID